MTSVYLQENVTVGYHPVKSKPIKSRYVSFSNSVKVVLLSHDKMWHLTGKYRINN